MKPTAIFNFSRPLPTPFKTRIYEGGSSKYGDGKKSTLCLSTIKAINAYCSSLLSGTGAVGAREDVFMAEYKSAIHDNYHLVVYDSQTGKLKACKYSTATENSASYVISKDADDGAAIIMSLIPKLMEDEEFEFFIKDYAIRLREGHPDLAMSTSSIAIMCDNAYMRVKSGEIKLELPDDGQLDFLRYSDLEYSANKPNVLMAGNFKLFQMGKPKPAPAIFTGHRDFEGKYTFTEREYSEAEQSIIPHLSPWYVIPEEIVTICEHAKETTAQALPMRNFLLRGSAGTGKTEGARAIAAGLGLPYLHYTCSAGVDEQDLLGQVFPNVEGHCTYEGKEMVSELYDCLAGVHGVPSIDDIIYDPEGSFERLQKISVAGKREFSSHQLRVVSELLNKFRSDTSFRYVETDLIRAFKHGYLLELQEPSTIIQPGVLVRLNSLLEQRGSMKLPTGEIIKRHPDTVIVITTNVDYAGCRDMNQSVLDRMNMVYDMEMPTQDEIVQRAMNITGFPDRDMVMKMADVAMKIDGYCRDKMITDGVYGLRSLYDWIESTKITKNPYKSAELTLISKATQDSAEQKNLLSFAIEPYFTPKGRSRKAAA